MKDIAHIYSSFSVQSYSITAKDVGTFVQGSAANVRVNNNAFTAYVHSDSYIEKQCLPTHLSDSNSAYKSVEVVTD